MPYFLLHSEKKKKQKHKVWLKVYMPQELGDLHFEEKVAGAIFDLPYQESYVSFTIGSTELEQRLKTIGLM